MKNPFAYAIIIGICRKISEKCLADVIPRPLVVKRKYCGIKSEGNKMGKFDGILLCTDLDGTVLNKDKSVSEENLKAIEYFKSEGGKFTIITGRMPYTAEKITAILKPNAPIGCVNGGGVYDTEKKEYVWVAEVDPDAVELAEYAVERIPGLGYQVNTPHKAFFCSENEAMKWHRTITGAPFVFKKPSEIEPPMMKILFGDLETDKLEYL